MATSRKIGRPREPLVLPPHLGIGLYIHDSEESTDSEIERWLEEQTKEKTSTPHESDASTEYVSVFESWTTSGDSNTDSDSDGVFFVDDDQESICEWETPIPPPPEPSRRKNVELEQEQSIQRKVLKQSLQWDAKLSALNEKRLRQCAKIEQEHITRSVNAMLEFSETSPKRSESATGTAQKIREVFPTFGFTSNIDRKIESTSSQTESTKSEIKKETIGANTTDAESKRETIVRPVPIDRFVSSSTEPKERILQVPNQIDRHDSTTKALDRDQIARERPSEVEAAQTGFFPHPADRNTISPFQTEMKQTHFEPIFGRESTFASNFPQTAAIGEIPNPHHPETSTESQVPQAFVASSTLLQQSEEMQVPYTLPPPSHLFFPHASEMEITKEKIALHASKTAIEFESYHKQIAQEMVQQMGDFATNIANREICRAIDKRMKLDIMQISSTKSQIESKVRRILQTFSEIPNPQGVIYAYVQFSRHLISKCAGITDSLVFAVAKTTVQILEVHPRILSMLLSFLHEVSVLTVPKFYSSVSDRDTLLDKLGFKDLPEEDMNGKESEDTFIERQSGYVKFYAAIVELDSSVHGLEYGWTYLSRMLNNLPPSRITASALMSFLSVAGYSLFTKYRRQFYKVLLYIHSRFLLELASSNNTEAQAVYMRLQTYLERVHFTKAPQCKLMPDVAESFNVHA